MPTKYTRRHILLAVFLSLQACALGILLHNGLYALFFHVVCKALYGYVCPGDEAVFFIIALIIVPTGFVMGMIGRMWQWGAGHRPAGGDEILCPRWQLRLAVAVQQGHRCHNWRQGAGEGGFRRRVPAGRHRLRLRALLHRETAGRI